MAAEKAGRRIAVETKGFLGESAMADLEQALGQFILYRTIMDKQEPDRHLFLAIPEDAVAIFEEPVGRLVTESQSVNVIVFDIRTEEIIRRLP